MSDYSRSDCSIILTGIPVGVSLRFPETKKYIRKCITDSPPENPAGFVCVSEQAYADWEKAGNPINAFAEFCLLCQPVSEALMSIGHCVFHAAALRYRDQAILIAGGSGTGKSTHCRMLLEGYPDEFSVINGDKPTLAYDGKQIIVHPSPWTGKEGLHGAGPAVLKHLFILRRCDEDSIQKCSDKEAAVFSFPLVFQSFEDETVIRKAGMMTEKIVQNCSCWKFNSRDIKRSSDLLYRTIKEAAEDDL